MMRSILFAPLLNIQFSSLEKTNMNKFLYLSRDTLCKLNICVSPAPIKLWYFILFATLLYVTQNTYLGDCFISAHKKLLVSF